MKFSTLLTAAAFGLVGGLSSLASAGNPTDVDVDPPDPQVWMGQSVPVCGWPTAPAVVSGGGLCTGTLVHPRVVVYAAHCGGGSKTIRFAENAWNGGQSVGASCQTNPGYNNSQGTDWAYCVLNQDVNLPIAPILYGCELETLKPLEEVAVIGFGNNNPGSGSGTKRWGLTTLLAVNMPGNTTDLGGGDEPSVCPGDSGGPAMIKGADGVWRVFGIASTVALGPNGEDCGGFATHSIIAGAVPWIEESSGYDITPCHDVDGTWNPGPGCTGFFGSAANSYGNWGNWCAGTPGSPDSTTCGPGQGSPPEDNPPTVSITSPAADLQTDEIPYALDVEMNASDDSGFVTVWIRINGEDFMNQVDSTAPFVIQGISLPEGTYELRGVAEDYWGNQAVSSPRTIIVGNSPDPTTTGDGDSGNDSGNDTGDSTSSDSGFTTGLTAGLTTAGDFGLDGDDSGSGCACSVDERPPLAPIALTLLVLGAAFRRRRD